jgi:hypothetical protein
VFLIIAETRYDHLNAFYFLSKHRIQFSRPYDSSTIVKAIFSLRNLREPSIDTLSNEMNVILLLYAKVTSFIRTAAVYHPFNHSSFSPIIFEILIHENA